VTSTHSSNPRQLLNLRIVRGPLLLEENETILSEYNKRIDPEQIPLQEFLHWVQDSPEGPAWHAILESHSRGIVGHQCFIPLRANCQGKPIVAAKSEYTFLHEDFQTTKISGFEEVGRPTHMVAANQLVQRCQTEGWGPFLISTIPSLRRRGFYGFIATDFHLWECLLALRPIAASWHTPNLSAWQRGCLLLVGAVQKVAWWATILLIPANTGLCSMRIDDSPLPARNGSLSFFRDVDSLGWRYPTVDYQRMALNAQRDEYVIYKKGSATQYLRICQWLMDCKDLSLSRIAGLIQVAREEGAMGVRWAIYGSDREANSFVQRLRRFGFLCVPRAITLQIKSDEKEFLSPEAWNLTDAMFSFHW